MMGVRFTQKTRRAALISLYHISQEPWKGFISWYMVFPMNFGYLFDLFGNQWNLPAGVRNCVKSVCIRTEYREILCISLYSVRMLENTDQNNSECGHYSCSEECIQNPVTVTSN